MNEDHSFDECVDAAVQADPAYAAEAYYFLRDALDVAVKHCKKNRGSQHVSAAELLEGFRIHALKEFGPMALTVLEYWGVKSCEDVGRLVFNLVETGAFAKTEQDTMDSFRRCYDFEEAFAAPFRPSKKKRAVA